ncbi:MAG TPA: EAL domain-containing protein [Thermoanaerobaculia bacterium]|nr:EAL domain-containing protein [Thermoanaerobaculia bacterium]
MPIVRSNRPAFPAASLEGMERRFRAVAAMMLHSGRQRSDDASSLRTTIAVLRAQQEATLDGILVVASDRQVITHNRRFSEIWGIPEDVVRRGSDDELLEYAFSIVEDVDGFAAEVEYLYRHPREVRSADIVTLKGGRILSRASVPVVSDSGEVTGRAWYFRDVTESRKGETLQSALFRISEVARSAPDLDELYSSLHQILGELMDVTNFYIALRDDETGELRFPYFVDQFDPKPPTPRPTRGLTNYVLRTGEALLATPAIFDALVARGEVEQIGAPSVDWLGVPLSIGSKTFGVLGVQSYTENVRYGEKEKEILLFVSQHVASAIEHKRREDALRESENRYRQMFTNNRAIKLLIDPSNGSIVDANPAACEFYGYSKDSLTSLKIWDINTLPRDQVLAEMAQAQRQSRFFFRFRHRIASGEIRDVEVHSGPIEMRGRTMLYSIIHDVTERKRAEAALQQSEEKFRNIFNFASVGIYQSTSDGTILTANETLARILGYATVDELLEKNMARDVYFHRGERAELIRKHDPKGAAGDLEILWKRKDGAPVWVQLNAHSVKDREGKTIYYEGFVHDVTERKLAEQILRNQSAAMKASIDGIAILDADGRFIYMNDAYARLYGHRAPETMLGEHWRVVHDEIELRRFEREILPQFIQNRKWRGETTGMRRDGSTFPQEISLTMVESGEIVCVARDITERTYAEEQIRHLAYHDALTGLPNRLLFKDRLTVALSRAQRDRAPLAVLFLDLDRFKVINDSLGHNTGDQLLQAVAARVQACLRESDTVARLGGDEFTVLLPTVTHSEDSIKIAHKILEAIRLPFILDGRDLYTTTSMGISVYPDDGSDAETLIKNADTAMYQAKEQGRDHYQLFNANINARAQERLSLVSGLRKALTNQEFILHYQPIYNLATNRIYGMEALLRWNHPSWGVVAPSNFILLAEASGLMPGMGYWALQTACRQLREWERRGYLGLTLAVNLSVTQLQQPDLVDKVTSAIKEAGIRPESVELEITESSAMQDPETSILALYELKQRGLRISLDDFGTGHSSLSYLKRFPIDTLKVDQSFIRDLTTDSDTAAIVTAIIAMAYSLKLKVIAEGVEQEEQRIFLSNHGCDYMQGFLFNHPVAAEQFDSLLLAQPDWPAERDDALGQG